jgi:CRP-like cAMP-binding protein
MIVESVMKSYLAKIFDFVGRLDEDSQTALDGVTTRRKFGKGEYLLPPDEICRNSFFIEKGIARKFYVTEDGREITTELYFADDLALSFQSYTLQTPSLEIIEALEETEATVTDYEAFQNLKTAFPKLLELDLMITEYHAMWLEERLRDFHTLDATQRYRKLIAEHPHFIQNVKLTFIASYLGISLETLSRIRAKI